MVSVNIDGEGLLRVLNFVENRLGPFGPPLSTLLAFSAVAAATSWFCWLAYKAVINLLKGIVGVEPTTELQMRAALFAAVVISLGVFCAVAFIISNRLDRKHRQQMADKDTIISEKDVVIAEKDTIIVEKDAEIARLRGRIP